MLFFCSNGYQIVMELSSEKDDFFLAMEYNRDIEKINPMKWRDEAIPMNFKFAHNNINVLNLDESLAFYKEALGLTEVSRKIAEDGSFILVYLGDTSTKHQLELTWLRDRHDPYDLGDNEIHIAFTTSDFEAAHEKHKAMGCICYENKAMGIYFIADPDGYWLEIIPEKN